MHSKMLNKLFKVHKLTPSRKLPPKLAAVPASSQPESSSSALKIVHAGGHVDCYYTAMPAVRILEKFPSYILARPEVFRRPWDSVVRSDGILIPGEKFFLVPRRTVKKLRQRIGKPDRQQVSSNSFISKSSVDVSVDKGSCKEDDFFISKSFSQRRSRADHSTDKSVSLSSASGKKTAVKKKHVRFAGIIEGKNRKMEDDDPQNKSLNSLSQGVKRRPRNSPSSAWQWQPSLSAICERTAAE